MPGGLGKLAGSVAGMVWWSGGTLYQGCPTGMAGAESGTGWGFLVCSVQGTPWQDGWS